MNPLLPYVDKRIVITTPTEESCIKLNIWIKELGGRELRNKWGVDEGYCMEDVTKANNCHCTIKYAKASYRTVINFEDLIDTGIIEVW